MNMIFVCAIKFKTTLYFLFEKYFLIPTFQDNGKSSFSYSSRYERIIRFLFLPYIRFVESGELYQKPIGRFSI